MPRRQGDGLGHTRARRKAQEAAVRGLVADAVAEAHEAHAAARHDLTGSVRAFLNETALPAVRALNGAGAPTLLPAMHQMVNTVQPGFISPEAALYGRWMEWRESNRSGRPLSSGGYPAADGSGVRHVPPQQRPSPAARPQDALPRGRGPVPEPGAGHIPGGSVRAGCGAPLSTPTGRGPGGGRDHGVRGRRGRGARPPPTDQPGVRRHQAYPPVRHRMRGVPQGAHLVPRPPSRRRTRPAAGPTQTCPTPSPGPGVPTTGGRSSGKSALAPPCSSWSSRPAGTRSGSWGSPPPTSMGQHPYPAPPSRRPRRGTEYTPSCEHRRSPPLPGFNLVRLPPTPPDDPRGPRALGPAPDSGLWLDAWGAWLPGLPSQCRWMAAGPRPCGADATAGPPPPPPLPPAEHRTALPTARH